MNEQHDENGSLGDALGTVVDVLYGVGNLIEFLFRILAALG